MLKEQNAHAFAHLKQSLQARAHKSAMNQMDTATAEMAMKQLAIAEQHFRDMELVK